MHTGKTVVITGANRGIGMEVVKTFAKEHACLWVCARQYNEDFENLMEQLSCDYSTKIRTAYFDLENEEDTVHAIKNIINQSSTIDILINNAGISNIGFFNMTSVDLIKKTFEINFFSQLRIIQYISKKMIKQRSGSIINICSVSGVENKKGGLSYGSSKAALIYATKTLANEYGEYGIRVNAVSPGFIDTDMWRNRDENTINKMLSEIPLGRQGNVKDVAETVSFLASDKASYITGKNIIVDGGRI